MRILGTNRLIFVMIVMLVVPFFPCYKAFSSFPDGLVLKYHVTDDLQGEWDEQFTIHEVSPLQGESFFLLDISSTNGNLPQGTMLLNRSTWQFTLLNGTMLESPLQPPLLVNTSTWQLGKTITLPTYTGSYTLSLSHVSLDFGTFPCWQIQSIVWISIDDDYQQCNENWYYHNSEGILLKYTYELLASQHTIYTYRITRELTASNFQIFGIISMEDFSNMVLIWLGIGLVVLSFLLGVVFVLRHCRIRRFNTKLE